MIKQMISCLLAALPCALFPQEKIEGFYDRKAKVFHPHENLLQDRTAFYDCEQFKAGYAIVEKRTKDFANYGLIDTAGRVIIPFKYKKLSTFNNKNYFLFHTKDSIGLVNLSCKELLKYTQTSDDEATKKYTLKEKMSDERKTAIWYRKNTTHDFALIKIGSKIGLYLPDQERFVLPVECDNEPAISEIYNYEKGSSWNHILLMDRYAIYQMNGMRMACDISTGQKSDPYKDIVLLENNLFYVVTKEDKRLLLEDMINAKNVAHYELLELLNNHLLIRAEGKTGLMDINQQVKIPLKYDDIHFMDHRYVWLKKNMAWAIADVEGKLKTGFDFLNVDRLNADYFTDLLYYTRLDTTGGSMYVNNPKTSYNQIDNIKYIARMNLKNINSRISFSALYTRGTEYVITYAQKADGYHLILGKDATIEVNEAHWDAIYYLPGVADGPLYSYKKENKYGLQSDQVIYEAVLYNANPITCGRRCSWVKKGNIYTNDSCNPGGKPLKTGIYKDFVIR